MAQTPRITKSSNWLVVGAAPDAGEFFDVAVEWAGRQDACQIATNAAWQLYATRTPPSWPDYYWASDSMACKLFERAICWMHRAGTQIVTMDRNRSGLEGRGLTELSPVIISLPDRSEAAPTYQRDAWAHPRLSGLICLQIAANFRAARLGGTIVLVGMTGYKSNDKHIVADTLDGRMGKAAGAQHTREWIGPYTQSVIDAHRDMTFIVAGTPRYPLSGHNVIIAPTPQDLAEFLDRPPRKAA